MKNKPGLGVFLSSKPQKMVSAFYDADWAACPHIRKSITGYLVKIGESLVSWKSKKKSTISRNSTELEYMSLASTTIKLTWLLGMLKEIGVKVNLPVTIYTDIKFAIQIATNLLFHGRIKYIKLLSINWKTTTYGKDWVHQDYRSASWHLNKEIVKSSAPTLMLYC